jgi:hypothetical protein
MRRLARFLRQNVIALLALFVALGGTSYAAVELPANSVGTKQLKNGAVTAEKIKKAAVRAADINTNGLKVPYATTAGSASSIVTRIRLVEPVLSAENGDWVDAPVSGGKWEQGATSADFAFGLAKVTIPDTCPSGSFVDVVGADKSGGPGVSGTLPIVTANQPGKYDVPLATGGLYSMETGTVQSHQLTFQIGASCTTGQVTLDSLSVDISGAY